MQPLRWSNLKHMADCPAMYRYRLDNPIEPTPAMKFGSLVHALVLGAAPNSFTVYEGTRRGKAWDEFKEAHQNVEIVTADEWTRAVNCADAVKADPLCGALLKRGLKEHRLEWEIAGRECAGTPDLNGGILCDLKVTAMVNPARFPSHCRRMMWHGQLAWYKNGVELQGDLVSEAYIIAVDPKPPHLCIPYLLTDDTLEIGTRQWRGLFERLRGCEESDAWPGYTECAIPLEIYDDDLTLNIAGEEYEL